MNAQSIWVFCLLFSLIACKPEKLVVEDTSSPSTSEELTEVLKERIYREAEEAARARLAAEEIERIQAEAEKAAVAKIRAEQALARMEIGSAESAKKVESAARQVERDSLMPNRQGRAAARAALAGTKLEILELADGKKYEDVTVKNVSEIEIKFVHANGIAVVNMRQLKAEDRERFQYDEDAYRSAIGAALSERAISDANLAKERRSFNAQKAADYEAAVQAQIQEAKEAEYDNVEAIRTRITYLELLKTQALQRIGNKEKAILKAKSGSGSRIVNDSTNLSAQRQLVTKIDAELQELEKKLLMLESAQ